jgi:peptidoglycan/xylan/chitin deacetylase (PgdA/CDA1 family)
MPTAPRVRAWDRAAHRISPFLFRRPATRRSGGSIVSFTFDDFPRSAYRHGGAILSSHGARGTYYASFALAGVTDETGEYFASGDLDDLRRDGHELASHTFSHRHRLMHDPLLIRRELEENEAACRRLAPGAAMRNFAYPYGLVGPTFKYVVGRRYASSRGTRLGLNVATFDLCDLRANPLYAATAPSAVATIIEENRRQGGWLIFYTHDVCDAPSTHGCTPDQLEAAVKAALASANQILTVDEALRQVEPVGADAATPAASSRKPSPTPTARLARSARR